ncbi:hypothetical protein OE88DRAFT_1730060 [Heliocybe sulcata]|uniref:DNA replication regulator SLD2 n=1 Tax=Heliocybe sulcata TaxID=5364 RepID=A0A5C3NIE6_9AGAM|nr:hypothetical protein OE88DRAFT_1730060 [Heliocybe sulcata]
MSDNAAQLRTEIKAWERDFKQQHGRPPSVQDIKHQPAIAEKYKLYKRLSKVTTSQISLTKPTTSDPPSTPPRSQPGSSRASLIASKPRAVHVAAPSTTSNPFSPVKSKGKQKEATQTQLFERGGERYSNPFATPTKSKTVRRPVTPDPFPLIQTTQPATPKDDPSRHAVSRARKRLRGEPVSPSPVKEKRQRVGSQSLLSFSKLNQPSNPAFSDDDDEEPNHDADEGDSSFLDDSPVKPSANGKSFRQLFEENPVNKQGDAKPRAALSRSKTVPNNAPLFPSQKNKPTLDKDVTKPFPSSQPLPGARISKPSRSGVIGQVRKPSALKQVTLGGFLPGKDDLYADAQPSDAGQSSKAASSSGTTPPAVRGSTKRPLAEAELESEQAEPGTTQTANGMALLPPSPLQKPAKPAYHGKGKGKQTNKAGSRKKAKVADDLEEDEDDSPDEPDVRVKVLDWSWNRTRSQAGHTNSNNDSEDPSLGDDALDPSLTWKSRSARNELAPHSLELEGEFAVDLPDHLKSMLSISPTKPRDRREERVVRELLYRERAAHYDPVKGGEVWDVGEGDEDAEAGTEGEGEDDWEGEPVPWAAGEL